MACCAGLLWEFAEYYAVDRAVGLGMTLSLDIRVECGKISGTLNEV